MLVKHGKPLKNHAQFHHVYRCYVLCLPFSENWHCFRPHILHPWPGLWAQLPRNRERPRWSVILLETLLLESRTGENVREAKPPKFTGAMDWWVVVSRFNPFRRLMNKTWNHQNRSTDGLTQSFHAFASHMWNESAASIQSGPGPSWGSAAPAWYTPERRLGGSWPKAPDTWENIFSYAQLEQPHMRMCSIFSSLASHDPMP